MLMQTQPVWVAFLNLYEGNTKGCAPPLPLLHRTPPQSPPLPPHPQKKLPNITSKKTATATILSRKILIVNIPVKAPPSGISGVDEW